MNQSTLKKENIYCYFIELESEFSDSEVFNKTNIFLLRKKLSTMQKTIKFNIDVMSTSSRILQDSHDPECSHILIYSLEQTPDLGGSIAKLTSFVAELAERNIAFTSVCEDIDSRESALTFTQKLISGVNQFKKNQKAFRIRQKIERARKLGIHLGRPKKSDDNEIKELRKQGLSLNQISSKIGVSKGAVQYSLRRAATEKSSD